MSDSKAAENVEPNEYTPARSKRPRKQPDFFKPEGSPRDVAHEIKPGFGAKLSDIPNVVFHLSKVPGKDKVLEDFHTLIFKRRGKATTRKREILSFSGLRFDGDEKAETEKVEERLRCWKLDHLHKLMDLLDIRRGTGDKASKVKRVVEFLLKPQIMSDVNLAQEATQKHNAMRSAKKKHVAPAQESNEEEQCDEASAPVKSEEDEDDFEPKTAKKRARSKKSDTGAEPQTGTKKRRQAKPAEAKSTVKKRKTVQSDRVDDQGGKDVAMEDVLNGEHTGPAHEQGSQEEPGAGTVRPAVQATCGAVAGDASKPAEPGSEEMATAAASDKAVAGAAPMPAEAVQEQLGMAMETDDVVASVVPKPAEAGKEQLGTAMETDEADVNVVPKPAEAGQEQVGMAVASDEAEVGLAPKPAEAGAEQVGMAAASDAAAVGVAPKPTEAVTEQLGMKAASDEQVAGVVPKSVEAVTEQLGMAAASDEAVAGAEPKPAEVGTEEIDVAVASDEAVAGVVPKSTEVVTEQVDAVAAIDEVVAGAVPKPAEAGPEQLGMAIATDEAVAGSAPKPAEAHEEQLDTSAAIDEAGAGKCDEGLLVVEGIGSARGAGDGGKGVDEGACESAGEGMEKAGEGEHEVEGGATGEMVVGGVSAAGEGGQEGGCKQGTGDGAKGEAELGMPMVQ